MTANRSGSRARRAPRAPVTLPSGLVLDPSLWPTAPHKAPVTPRTLADLFVPPPPWGLRGDPVVWWGMGQIIGDGPVPDRAEALAQIIDSAFKDITQGGKTDGDKLRVRFLAPLSPGMSGGIVSLRWWHDTARPLLLSRWDAAQGGNYLTPPPVSGS